MLSGNGRHRRPRQAPAFLVTAGVTSAGVALPLLGAGASGAVEGETWDRVAECESGGDWLADGANGYYGGLQLPLGMWLEYGGAEFADRPDLASRSQQIAVAERILADRGPRAFPGCALLSGLRAEYRAEVTAREAGDGGRDEAAEDAGAGPGDGGGGSAGELPAEPDGAAGDSADTTGGPAGGTEKDQSGESDGPGETERAGGPAEAGGTGGTDRRGESGGKHRGTPAPEEAERERERSGGGRHAARDGIGDAEGEDGRNGAEDGRNGEEEPAGADYRVLPGDSLYAIAGNRGVPGGWPALYERNAAVIGEDPDHILPGQLLDLDTSGEAGITGATDEFDVVAPND